MPVNGEKQRFAWPDRKREMAREVMGEFYEKRILRTWLRDKPEGWELISGRWSPFYIQVRGIASYPKLLALVGRAMAEVIREEAPSVNRLIGVAAAGVPIATAVCLILDLPMAYTRKLPGVRKPEDVAIPKEAYGEHSLVEGDLANEDRLVIIDDVVAEFTSKRIAMKQVNLELERRNISDASIECVAVVVDREQRLAGELTEVPIISLIQLRSSGLAFLRGVASDREIEVMSAYVNDSEPFQNKALQHQLTEEAITKSQ